MNLAVLRLIVSFFTQETAYEMRIRVWSSDVCSSDLDGNADQMDQGKSEPYRQRGKAGRCPSICGAENHDEEAESQHDLDDPRRQHGVAPRRVCPVAVCRKAAGEIEAGLAAGLEVAPFSREDCAGDTVDRGGHF